MRWTTTSVEIEVAVGQHLGSRMFDFHQYSTSQWTCDFSYPESGSTIGSSRTVKIVLSVEEYCHHLKIKSKNKEAS
ncbi:hypothetical protein ACFPU1_12755 [Thalassorhabdus alkalitolerans]|uniref:Uncharacterized protein n=1 Tax=Thalassorhabdus alkalitolerans TaxID=2282697 RepID=A0ABW0YNC7_9BACI